MSAVGQVMILDRVQDILHSRPEYLANLPHDYEKRLIFPAFATRKLRLLCDGKAFMTWFSPSYPPDEFPDGREFFERGPVTWLLDVVAMPGVPWMRLGRELNDNLYLHAGVKDGERVLFLRWPRQRVGYATIHKPRRV